MSAFISKLLGVAFLVVGGTGFFTGHAEVAGFGVSLAHNLVHLLSGILFLAVGFVLQGSSRIVCLIFGLVYGLVAVMGFLGVEPVISLLNINQPDNFLHTAIAALCIFAYFSDNVGGAVKGHV